jgi:parvulin-like peptidyl-prolyl isomerase
MNEEIRKLMNDFVKLLVVLLVTSASLIAQTGPAAHSITDTTAGGQMGPVASHTPTVVNPAPAGTLSDLKQPVARVNGIAITQRDLQEQMQRLFPYYSMHGGKVPEKYQAEVHDKALQQLIDEELIYQRASKSGVTVGPATMAKLLREAHGRFPSQAAYADYAKSQYGSVQAFEKRIRRAVIIAKYQDTEIVQKSKVSDTKLRSIYEGNKKRFVRPESVWLQTISVNVPENASAEQLKMAETRMKEVLPLAKTAKNHDEFGLLAEKYSEDDYRVMLGDHKWVHLVGMPEAMAQVADGMKAGETSGVVKVPGAWVILRVNDKRPEKLMEFSEVAPQLRKEIESSAQKDRWEKLRAQLYKDAKIEML